MSNKLFQFLLKKRKQPMTHYAFELPHLNCHIITIDNVIHNTLVQDMPSPYEVFTEVDEYWLINWNEQVSNIEYMDLLTNEIKQGTSVSFTGTRPHKPR